MKTTLWNSCLELMKGKKSRDWQVDDIDKVLRNLKNNKSCDPEGYINEIFKPDVIGSNLRDGLLELINGIKKEQFCPSFMQKREKVPA